MSCGDDSDGGRSRRPADSPARSPCSGAVPAAIGPVRQLSLCPAYRAGKGKQVERRSIAFLPGRPMFRSWRARDPISEVRCVSGLMTMLLPIFFAYLLHLLTLGIGQYLPYIVARLAALNRQVGHQVAALSCQCP